MQKLSFDKFIDDIIVREEKSRRKNVQKEETPQREFIKRYREKPHNRIRFGSK